MRPSSWLLCLNPWTTEGKCLHFFQNFDISSCTRKMSSYEAQKDRGPGNISQSGDANVISISKPHHTPPHPSLSLPEAAHSPDRLGWQASRAGTAIFSFALPTDLMDSFSPPPGTFLTSFCKRRKEHMSTLYINTLGKAFFFFFFFFS